MSRPHGEEFGPDMGGGMSDEILMQQSRQQALETKWQQFGFPGKPPVPDSEASQRLIDIAKEYTECVVGPGVEKNTASDALRAASESARRVLHNKLAIMIFGNPRSGMDERQAIKIAKFATDVAYPGMSLEDVRLSLHEGKVEE